MDKQIYEVHLVCTDSPPAIGTLLELIAGENGSDGITLTLKAVDNRLGLLEGVRDTVDALWQFQRLIAEKLDTIEKSCCPASAQDRQP